MNWKDILTRAAKTFVQAFASTFFTMLAATQAMPSTFEEAWLALAPIIIASGAAGISAAWNIIKEYVALLKEGE